jgi:hypothetical protein
MHISWRRMNRAFLLMFLSVIISMSCGHVLSGQPDPWAKALISGLRCGMSVAEVQAKTTQEIYGSSEGSALFSETHFVSNMPRDGVTEIFFTFKDDRLESYMVGALEGYTSLRFSPKVNLCTEELTFFVRLNWTAPHRETDVYLDGSRIGGEELRGNLVSVSAGDHELRIEREGSEPIVEQLHLVVGGRGNIWLDLTWNSKPLG